MQQYAKQHSCLKYMPAPVNALTSTLYRFAMSKILRWISAGTKTKRTRQRWSYWWKSIQTI